MKCYLNLRRLAPPERWAAFTHGLREVGYEVAEGMGQADLLVTWNRIGTADSVAREYERDGRPVIVAENATWGNGFMGGRWLHLARNRHNTAGMFPVGAPDRYNALGVELAPWRTEGETVGLVQRGIGSPPTAQPRSWRPKCDRIRSHPGTGPCVPLEQDLAEAGKVVTWGSGAAVKALMMGIPVESHMPGWIGEQDNTDAGRLGMFQRLAWAQWRMAEIESGEAFHWLLG
jgi:hypothetical protein